MVLLHFPPGYLISSLTTPTESGSKIIFTVTHPFHPLYKKQFSLFDYRNTWGEHRVFYFDDNGELKNLPALWTSYFQQDPFLIISNKRSYFRPSDLLELSKLIENIKNNME